MLHRTIVSLSNTTLPPKMNGFSALAARRSPGVALGMPIAYKPASL